MQKNDNILYNTVSKALVKRFFGHQKPLKFFGKAMQGDVQSVKTTNSQVQGSKSRGIQCQAWAFIAQVSVFPLIQHTPGSTQSYYQVHH